jgi:hypothetical protein
MRRVCFICVLCTLLAASCRKWEVPRFDDSGALASVAIGDLHEYYRGQAEGVIADDIVIAGRVVSSTVAGNFYNTFFIDDGTGAVEIMAGMYDLDASYRPGQRVAVRARGLAVGWRDGAMQLGLPPGPGSYFPTEYFRHRAVIGRYVTPERDVAAVAPIETSLSELSTVMCGRLVRISGLTVDALSEAETWAVARPRPVTGYVKFRAAPTDSVTVVTSGYARFATMPLPHETVTLTGLLFYGRGGASKDHYLLKLRDETDIAF